MCHLFMSVADETFSAAAIYVGSSHFIQSRIESAFRNAKTQRMSALLPVVFSSTNIAVSNDLCTFKTETTSGRRFPNVAHYSTIILKR